MIALAVKVNKKGRKGISISLSNLPSPTHDRLTYQFNFFYFVLHSCPVLQLDEHTPCIFLAYLYTPRSPAYCYKVIQE